MPPDASTERTTRTACPYCGVGCGVLATPKPDGSVAIAGDPAHPANLGRLCSKGSALGETLALDDRLLHPLIDGERADWDAALDLVAARFKATIADHGPDAVAFYVSGQLLTEDYYVANKLMKGFVGSANIDTNSRLCMASSVVGHKRAFGSDTVPGCYEDLEQADLVVLVGSNLAWCHPVLYQRIVAARERRGLPKVVVVDPRATATCDIADMHLALAPGSDVALFAGLLAHIADAGAVDHDFVARHTSGFDAALGEAGKLTRTGIAAATGLTPRQLDAFYDLFVANRRVVTVYSQGVNQSTSGTDKVNAILNCHLATGRIGHPGMGPFSVTGQPNAMGGREVGGLANMLAAHMDLDNAAHRDLVRGFWRSPVIATKPGLKAVEMFRAVGDGRVKAIWIMGTNPVVSMPQADEVRAALAGCPFVVVSDVTRVTDTTALGHVLLPSLAWGEKSGTVTNSERRISRQRAFLPAPGESRADWWQMAQVASRMGHTEAFAWVRPDEIFAEYAGLTAAGNDGSRDLDIGACASIDAAGYAALEPFQWPRSKGDATGRERLFADGRFHTPDERARFVATPPAALPRPVGASDEFVLNTGRIRDQWHTMTRTAKSSRLMSHIGEPFVEMHPEDARRCGLAPAGLARIASRHGAIVVRVQSSPSQRRGSVFVPMHWTDQLASRARVDSLIDSDVDPISGQPGLKQAPVSVTPFAAAWYGVAVMRHRPKLDGIDYWAAAPIRGGWRIEMAGATQLGDVDATARTLIGIAGTSDTCAVADTPDVEVISYRDATSGRHRHAAFDGGRLIGAVLIAPEPVEASRAWLSGLFADQRGDIEHAPAERYRVLAGRPGGAMVDRGPTVCACFEIGRNQISTAAAGGCRTVAAIGEALSAGTNCGSCRAEIGRILAATAAPIARQG